MKAFFVALLVLAALVLLSLLRLGGQARYSAKGMEIKLLVGPFRFLLYPRKKREKKKKQGKHPDDGKKVQLGGSVELFQELLPLLLEAAGYVKQKIRIDHIFLDLIIAAEDPAKAAVAFGGTNALLGMILPPIENNFNVKERNIRTQVDFQRRKPELSINAAFTMTMGQLMVLAVRYGLKAFNRYRAYKKAHSAEGKADSYGKEPSHQ